MNPKGRKIGRFYVSRKLVERAIYDSDHETKAGWNAVFSDAVIIRAEMLYSIDSIEYCAVHPQFDELEEGVAAPLYDVIINKNFENNGVVSFSAKFIRSKL